MNTPPIFPPSKLNIRRRRAVATTAAAISLAGCGMAGQPAVAPMTPDQIEAERRVKAYQADIESALDKVDRERLRAAAEKKLAAPAPGSAAATPTGSAGAGVAGSSTPGASGATDNAVILASSNGEEDHGTGVVPEPIVVPHSVPAPVPVTPVSGAAEPAVPAYGVPDAAGEPGTSAHVVPVAPVADPVPAVQADSVAPVPSAGVDPVTFQPPAAPYPMGVVVSPMSGDSAVSNALISPFTPPSTPAATAMGAMTAVVTPAQMAAAEPAPAAAAPVEPTIDDAMKILKKNVDEHPTLSSALALALLDGADGKDVIRKLPETDQKVMTDLLTALDAMKSRTTSATLAERAAPLVDAARQWQADADLELPRLVLCTRVDSYGVFTPVSGVFEQGKRHTVIIYCEVAHFASRKGDDGWYTTKLAQQETLFTEDGLLVWRPNVEDVEDRSLNQRHDFYLVKKLTIPETLAAGKYTLRMSVTDRTTNKIKLVEMPIELQGK